VRDDEQSVMKSGRLFQAQATRPSDGKRSVNSSDTSRHRCATGRWGQMKMMTAVDVVKYVWSPVRLTFPNDSPVTRHLEGVWQTDREADKHNPHISRKVHVWRYMDCLLASFRFWVVLLVLICAKRFSD